MGYTVNYDMDHPKVYRFRMYILSFATGLLFWCAILYFRKHESYPVCMLLFPEECAQSFFSDINGNNSFFDIINRIIPISGR